LPSPETRKLGGAGGGIEPTHKGFAEAIAAGDGWGEHPKVEISPASTGSAALLLSAPYRSKLPHFEFQLTVEFSTHVKVLDRRDHSKGILRCHPFALRNVTAPGGVVAGDFLKIRTRLIEIDLIPSFGTKLSMISAKERGSGYVEEQAHRGADHRGAETTGSGT
jgi:hypothetical protein